MQAAFQPGDLVVWHNPDRVGFFFVWAAVVRVTEAQAIIRVDDPNGDSDEFDMYSVPTASLELLRRSPKPAGAPLVAAEQFFAEGEEFADEELDEEALARFRAAWDLLPEPKEGHELAFRTLLALADSHFHLGHWRKCQRILQGMLCWWDETGNSFILLRLGQCALELGNDSEAKNWLVGAFGFGGLEVVESEDPKYWAFLRERLDPPPDGWPEGW